ncbi:hypothetical protein AB0M43_33670 [Longispora sp. NPDC051575]|uniref:phage tail protein n=1 Tax=Longispora sp. NPDC051575 TaxID=3154943 RepID=UPI003431A920
MAGKKPGGVEAARVFVRVLPNTSDFAKALDRYLRRVEARERLTINATVDPQQLGREINKAIELASSYKRVNLRTDIDTTDIVVGAKAAAAEAERVAKVKIPVEVDGKRFVSLMRALSGKAAGALGILAQGGKLAVGVAALAGMATQAVHLVAALAPAAGALGAIPALAVAGAAAVATLKLAFSGIGDAMSGDPEALAKLAPSARAFVGELLRARPALDALKVGVQEAVFGPLSVEIQGLVRTWLPLLSRHLASIGVEFGVVFGNLAIGAQTPEFIRGISAALDAATVGVRGWGNAAIPIMQAVGNIVGAFAPAIGKVGAGLAEAARQAAEFVNAAAESGQLAAFVAQVGTTLRQIGGILVQVGGIFAAVFSAAQASGGGLLGNLQQILLSVNQFLSAGAGQSALIDFFSSASGVIRTLLPIVQTLAAGFGSVLAPALLKVAGLLGPGLQAAATAIVGIVKSIVDSGALDALASGLSTGLAALGPALLPLASALGGIVKAAAPLLPLVGKIAGVLAGVLGTALSSLEPLVTAIVDALGSSGLVDVLAEIGAELGPLIAALVADLMPTVKALLPLLGPLLLAAGKIIVLVLAAATSILTLLTPLHEFMAAKVLVPVVEALAKGLVWLAGAADKGAQGWRLLTEWIKKLDWSKIWSSIVQGAADALAWLTGLPGRALAAVGGLAAQLGVWALGVVTSAAAWFAALPGRIGAGLAALPGLLLTLATDAASKFLYAIGYGLGLAIRFVTEMPGKIWAALVSLFTGAQTLVSQGIDAVVAYFSSLPDRASAGASQLWAQAVALFQAGVTAAVGWVLSLRDRAVELVGDLFVKGRQLAADGVTALVGFLASLPDRAWAVLSSLPGKVKTALSGAVTEAKNIGQNIMNGMIDGITSMIASAVEAAKKAVGKVIKGAKDALGINSPSRVFAELGRFTVAGFVEGVEGAGPDAVGAMRGVLNAPSAPAYGLGAAGATGGPVEPVVNVSAVLRIGDGPVIDAVTTAVSRDPETFARHVRAGDRSLNRRG